MHVFRTAAGLDSLFVGETQIATQIRAAWEQARSVGASGRRLGPVLDKALTVAQRVHRETSIADVMVSIPTAALNLVRQVFRSLEGRKILLLGTGSVSELCAAEMMQHGAASTVVIDRSESAAQEVATRLGGTMAPLAGWWKSMLQADIVISATGCPHVVLTEQEAERIAAGRNRVALVILDIAMPRDVDPAVQGVDGILLYDLEKIGNAMESSHNEQRKTTVSRAEEIVAAEALAFRSRLKAAANAVPTVVALRLRLEEICRQELDSFITQEGPFTKEQGQSLHAVTAQVIQKIANSLARELKELPEREEQERMTAAISRLFHLESPKAALAGAKLGKKSEVKKNERDQSATTIN
jgi:glutamyl-tRNA reductase